MTSIMNDRLGGFFEFNNSVALSGRDRLKKICSKPVYFLNSSRGSLKLILDNYKKNKKKRILIPDFCCFHGIIPIIEKCGFEYDLYNIDDYLVENKVIENKISSKTSFILFCNYFGLFKQTSITKYIKKNYPDINIIIDSAIDPYFLLENKIDDTNADFIFTSLNKFFPVPDGSILKSLENLDVTYIKKENISFNYSLISSFSMTLAQSNSFYNKELEEISIKFQNKYEKEMNLKSEYYPISKLSMKIFSNINLSNIKKIRRSNYQYLQNQLSGNKFIKIVKKNLNKNDVPLVLPIEIIHADRDTVRSKLSELNIFCPVHWPLGKYSDLPIGSFSKNKILNGMGIIIDQRYNKSELNRIVNFFEKLG